MSLLFKAEWHPIGCIDFILLIHLSVEGQSGCFHIVADVTNAPHYKHVGTNIPSRPCFQLFGVYSEVEWLDPMIFKSIFNFLRDYQTGFYTGHNILHSP